MNCGYKLVSNFLLGLKIVPFLGSFTLLPRKGTIYRFDGYPQSMTEETEINSLPFSIYHEPDYFSLDIWI